MAATPRRGREHRLMDLFRQSEVAIDPPDKPAGSVWHAGGPDNGLQPSASRPVADRPTSRASQRDDRADAPRTNERNAQHENEGPVMFGWVRVRDFDELWDYVAEVEERLSALEELLGENDDEDPDDEDK